MHFVFVVEDPHLKVERIPTVLLGVSWLRTVPPVNATVVNV
jgi:hypothetical protein